VTPNVIAHRCVLGNDIYYHFPILGAKRGQNERYFLYLCSIFCTLRLYNFLFTLYLSIRISEIIQFFLYLCSIASAKKFPGGLGGNEKNNSTIKPLSLPMYGNSGGARSLCPPPDAAAHAFVLN